MAPHLLFLVTEDWYFWSHRRAIAVAALQAGFRVTLASRFASHREAIEDLGVQVAPVRLRRSSRRPSRELLSIGDLAVLYRRLCPDVLHHVAIKPVLYGSWAARIVGLRGVVNAISGLGYAFSASSWKARGYRTFATAAYATALRRKGTYTIFQNEDDRAYFVQRGMVQRDSTVLIPGSGVNLAEFRPSPEVGGTPVVLFAGRMLWSKGVADLAEAVRILRARGHELRAVLVGHSDEDNPEAIARGQLRTWQEEGLVEWLGRRDDVAELMAQSHLVVLGSEREGVPKVLLEAAGAGKPMVATDVPGCRDVVEDGVNGFLVPVHDAGALADAMERLIVDPQLRARMGAAARAKAESRFSEERVVADHLALYERVLREASR